MTCDMITKLYGDLKNAMLDKNHTQRNVIKMAISEIKNQSVNAGKECTDDLCLNVIKKMIKQHEDSIAQFTKANRTDLVANEALELTYLKFYVPNMMSEEETNVEIDNYIKLNNIEPVKKNMGMLMKHFKEYKEMDMKLASKHLQAILK